MVDYSRLKTDLVALGLLAITVFATLSLLSFNAADPPSHLVYPVRAIPTNLCGPAGAHLAFALRAALGIGAYLVLAGMVAFDLALFSRQENKGTPIRCIGGLLILLSACSAAQFLIPEMDGGHVVGSGGYVGAWICSILQAQFALGGSLILVSSLFIAGMLLATDLFCFRLIYRFARLPFATLGMFTSWLRNRGSQAADPATEPEIDLSAFENSIAEEQFGDEDVMVDEEADSAIESRKPIKVNPPATVRSEREELIASLEEKSRDEADEEYELPSLDFLEESEEFPYELLADKARIAAVTLEKTFEEFGLNVRVAEIDTGPVITQFELELEAGLRLSKVTALADDLAIALRVPAVRVVAPIPGKNTVGVEVPNSKQVMVRLRELIESCPREIEKARIPMFLGKDVSGRPLVVDMSKMPHLLIAGRTGTGKSVCLNSLILSILMTRSPDEVKMLMIDPKMVELSPYKRIPHLMHPVITDMKKAEAVLAWAVDKMEERYDLLARCGVRHLDSYNKLGKDKILERIGIDPESDEADDIPEQMPYIVIVADEMADMMMTSGKDVEGHIIRLAQKSRAVGLHLVLATQKPTVDVITGLIKSNLPARISFQVASRTDSRVVLDEMGAERLLGNGDMLYLAPGTSNVVRAQGTYVNDDEINAIIDFFGDQAPQYSEELAQLSATSSSGPADANAMRNRDELYESAIEVVIREGRGSVSLLQRCLGIGYGRAARLVDYMAEDGIVGDYNGSQAREVLYTMEQWDALQSGEELEEVPV